MRSCLEAYENIGEAVRQVNNLQWVQGLCWWGSAGGGSTSDRACRSHRCCIWHSWALLHIHGWHGCQFWEVPGHYLWMSSVSGYKRPNPGFRTGKKKMFASFMSWDKVQSKCLNQGMLSSHLAWCSKAVSRMRMLYAACEDESMRPKNTTLRVSPSADLVTQQVGCWWHLDIRER